MDSISRHGMKYTPEYRAWRNMKNRCLNKNAQDYEYYQARGITICERWVSSFVAFYEDMGPRPIGATLDRKDNNGNYEPGNCRWTTLGMQRVNRRIFKNNTSGFRGVDWRKSRKLWRSRIRYDKQLLDLGYFDNIQEAAWMYDQYAIQLHGDDAHTNFEYLQGP